MMIIFHRCRRWGIPWAKFLRNGEHGFPFWGSRFRICLAPTTFDLLPTPLILSRTHCLSSGETKALPDDDRTIIDEIVLRTKLPFNLKRERTESICKLTSDMFNTIHCNVDL